MVYGAEIRNNVCLFEQFAPHLTHSVCTQDDYRRWDDNSVSKE